MRHLLLCLSFVGLLQSISPSSSSTDLDSPHPTFPEPSEDGVYRQSSIAAAWNAYREAFNAQKTGDFDRAIRKYQEAICAMPTQSCLYYNIGTAYNAKGDLDNAIKFYEAALTVGEMNPLDVDRKQLFRDVLKSARKQKMLLKAYDQTKSNDFDKAIVSYEEATRIGEDAITRQNLAGAFLSKFFQTRNTEYLPKSILNYKRAIELDPTLTDAHYYLAAAYECMHRIKDAASEYQDYLRRDPHGKYANDCKQRLKLLTSENDIDNSVPVHK